MGPYNEYAYRLYINTFQWLVTQSESITENVITSWAIQFTSNYCIATSIHSSALPAQIAISSSSADLPTKIGLIADHTIRKAISVGK